MSDDALAIANLKAAYCAAGDLFATDVPAASAGTLATLLPDAVCDYGFTVFEGAEALVAFMAGTVAGNSEWMIHMLGSPRIVVNADTATGDWTIAVHAKRKGAEVPDLIVGRYSDEFRRMPDGWRISRLKFTRSV
jgi:SnoaL-like domain